MWDPMQRSEFSQAAERGKRAPTSSRALRYAKSQGKIGYFALEKEMSKIVGRKGNLESRWHWSEYDGVWVGRKNKRRRVFCVGYMCG